MPLSQLNAHQHDQATRALVTLAGEIDLATAPFVRTALAARLRDGICTVDVDLTAVTFCDAGGLNAFLTASGPATDAGTTLYPLPTLARMIEITGSGSPPHELHAVRPPRVPAAAGGAW
ncbi:STAS domain-containing protein [Streptomyces chartreusis]|uniref:STAS domain-containing protein n=1 Tax=Streptomyces chartreusis TaxID=1969 RepID=UPI0004C58583